MTRAPFALFFAALGLLRVPAGAQTVPAQRAAVAAKPAAAPAKPAPAPPLTAQAFIVMDLDSGRVLRARNPDQRLFPASTTKMMTCLIATERGNLNQIIRASPAAAATGESGIGLLAGENHTLRELLEAAMVRSANDGCVAIAEGIAQTQPKFVALMNARAKALGCKNTHFANPHGLHDPNHFTTARDLALIGRAVTKVKVLNEIARMKTATISGNYKIGPTRLLLNRNRMLWRWPACDGLKTGYTRQAGNCLVGTATMPDPTTGKPWRLLCVTLKSKGGFSYPENQRLLENAFKTYVPQQVGEGSAAGWNGPVEGGAFPLRAVTVGAARLPLLASEKATLKERIEMKSLQAPIAKGQRVGDAVFYARGKPIVRLPLVAAAAVPQTMLARTVPAVGKPVSLWAPWQRYGAAISLGLAAIAGLLLLAARRRRLRRARRKGRPAGSFEAATLPKAGTKSAAPRSRS